MTKSKKAAWSVHDLAVQKASWPGVHEFEVAAARVSGSRARALNFSSRSSESSTCLFCKPASLLRTRG